MDLLKKIRVKDVMIAPVHTIFEEDDLIHAHEMFIAYGVSYLCVVDHSHRLGGLISRKYLYKAKSPIKIIEGQNLYDKNIIIDGDSYFDKDMLSGYLVRSIMRRDPFTLGPDEPVATAVIQMAQQRIGCIPIVNGDKKILGVLTNQDIVNVTADLLQQK